MKLRFVSLNSILMLSLLSGILQGQTAQSENTWAEPVQQCWAYKTDDLSSLRVASDNENHIVLPLLDGRLVALEPNTGQPVWFIRPGGSLLSEIFVNARSLYAANTTQSDSGAAGDGATARFYSVDIRSGLTNWIDPLPDAGLDSAEKLSIAINDQNMFIASDNGRIIAVRKSNRSAVWQTNTESNLTTSPLLTENYLVIGTENKTIIVLSKATGDLINQIPLGTKPTTLGATARNLIVGDEIGAIQAIGLRNSETKWRARTGGKIVELLDLKGGLIALSNDNFAYSFSEGDGNLNWKRRLPGRSIGSALLNERTIVFVTFGSNDAIVVDLKSGRVVNRLTIDPQNSFISPPVVINNTLILPTSAGILAFRQSCSGTTG